MIFDSRHIATSIDRPAKAVYAFVADPTNLPSWAHGLANSDVELVDGTWTVESPMGPVTVRFTPPNDLGVADHDVTLPSGEVVTNPLRVVPNADGCDVVFTVHRREGMSDTELDADVAAVIDDLAKLRSLLEEA